MLGVGWEARMARDHSEDLREGGRIILKWTLGK